MHLLHQHDQQQKQLFSLFLLVFIPPSISAFVKPSILNIRCNQLHQNCTFLERNNSSTDSLSPTTRYSQGLISLRSATSPSVSSTRPRPTTRPRATTKANDSDSDFDAFSENLKRAAFILAGIALGLGILRICLMLCKKRSPSRSIANRQSATVRPQQVSTIEHHQFKPDLPPAYAEAIVHLENDENKLPTYEELPDDQREEHQYAYNNNTFVTTQV